MTTPAAATADTAAAVKAALDKAGLSEAEAARRTGIPQTTLNRRLVGNPPGFTIAELSSLASLLGIDTSDLLTIQTSTESAASLSERFDVSRQHIYKLRAGKQVPWRQTIGPIHPDDTLED